MSDCRTLRPPSLLDGTTARRFAIAFTGTIVYTGVPYPPIMSAGGSAGSCARRSDDTDARREARRCGGRSDRSAQSRWLRLRRLGHPPRRESTRLGPAPAGPGRRCTPADRRPRSRRTRAARTRTATQPSTDRLPPSRLTVPAIRPAVGAERTGRAGGAMGIVGRPAARRPGLSL
jgi:hypothetical protein